MAGGSAVERRAAGFAGVVALGGQRGGLSERGVQMAASLVVLIPRWSPVLGLLLPGWRGGVEPVEGAGEQPKHEVWVKNLTLYFYPFQFSFSPTLRVSLVPFSFQPTSSPFSTL